MDDSTESFPKALAPPNEANTTITKALIDNCIAWSRKSPRGRIIQPLHKGPESNLHRMLNALQPGTYIQPHRHLFPPKAESIIVLRGAIFVIIFESDGAIQEVHPLKAGSMSIGMDSEPGVYHTFAVTEPDSVIYEVKPGPYNPADDKDFADWAPAESDKEVKNYLRKLIETAEKMGRKA